MIGAPAALTGFRVQHARDRGLNAATGEVIVRIDADTRLPAGRLAAVEATFGDPPVDAATGPPRAGG